MSESPNNPQAKTPAPAVIPYATPTHLRTDEGCWRQGNLVVMSHGFKKTPPYCYKCGKPAKHFPRITVFLYRTFQPTKSVVVHLPLCGRHYGVKIAAIVLGCILFITGILFVSVAFSSTDATQIKPPDAFIWGSWFIIAALFTFYLSQHHVKPTDINDRYVTLKGAGKEFLDKLPEI